MIPLSEMAPGETGIIEKLEPGASTQVRLLEMGLLPGREVRLVRRMPFKGPLEIKLGESYLALRSTEASHILVKRVINESSELNEE